MALAIDDVISFKDSGQENHAIVTIAGSGTYDTGGQTVSWKKQLIKSRRKPTFGTGYTTSGYAAIYDVANNKVKLFNGTTEFSNGGSLTGVSIRMSLTFPKG